MPRRILVEPDKKPLPWEIQPGESAKSFQAFIIYRDLGAKRSYVKTAELVGKKVSTVTLWGRTHLWVSRVEAWVSEQDRITREELSKGVTSMRKRHVDLAIAMLVKAAQALQRIPADELKPRDIATMVDIASKLERLSRGESTEKTEASIASISLSAGVIDVKKLTAEEIENFEAIIAKAAAGIQD